MLEYSCMPIGELSDLIDLYLARSGAAEVTEVRNGIPIELE